MIVLGIDTSCDDTGIAVVENGLTIRSNLVASQHTRHVRYGGIVPAVASRQHTLVINHMIKDALAEAEVTFADLDAIAVSSDQGLAPALAVGVATAKGLSLALDIPLLGVHHVEGHIYSNLMAFPDQLQYPFLCLTVAGGHTMMLLVEALGEYRLVGTSRDDSAGEAYDKVARRLGLGYPGGPVIDTAASDGDPTAFEFPRPMLKRGQMDFSYSGLKTAVNRLIGEYEANSTAIPVADICASFQRAVMDTLVTKTVWAVQKTGVSQVAVAGGVASNSSLRERLPDELPPGAEAFFPPRDLCIDNGAMIAGLAFHRLVAGERSGVELDSRPNAPLGSHEVKYKHESKYRRRTG